MKRVAVIWVSLFAVGSNTIAQNFMADSTRSLTVKNSIISFDNETLSTLKDNDSVNESNFILTGQPNTAKHYNILPAILTSLSAPIPTITASGPTTFCAGGSVTLSAPVSDVWTQKTDFGGGNRYLAIGFSIGAKGYIGTGYDGTVFKKDFWEYDPTTNVWTQKADFAGTARYAAVGFNIGSKGYIGTGNDGTKKKDFWEYDPVSNVWTQKVDFTGVARDRAVGFSIGSKGYIGTGSGGSMIRNDFWEYDPVTNVWTQRADVGGGGRQHATGFSINTKGYVGTGDGIGYYKDFWEYDPISNVWVRKADFGGIARSFASSFNIGSKGYIGTGLDGAWMKDFWEYDPVTNIWTRKADVGINNRSYAIGFGIGSKGYIGTGLDGGGGGIKKDFWEYDPLGGNSFLWSTGATTQSIIASTTGSYTVTVTDMLGSPATSVPTIVTVITTNTWAGGGTNNWNTGSNWSCGIAPNSPLIDAIILNGAVPMPVLFSNILVRDIALNGTATVDINDNTLTINRAITGTGNFKGSAASNLTLKGDAGILRFATGAALLKDLLITDTGSATLVTPLSIVAGSSPGSVIVNANAVLNSGGNLTLKSDVNSTARIGILDGDISGDVTVERFINTGTNTGEHTKSWQFLATPVAGQTIFQSWQEAGASPTGFGTIITGTGSGFDAVTILPSIKTYNSVSNNWTAVSNTGNLLQEKQGYMLFVRGDRTVTTPGSTPNNTNMRSKGLLYSPINPPPSVPVSANKFQSFGNPYASGIEFSKLLSISPGINDVFYVWDPKLAGSYNLGGYQTITGLAGYVPTVGIPPNGNDPSPYYPAGVASPFIQSGQAVFVKGGAIGGNVNFNENCKINGSRLVNRDASGDNTTNTLTIRQLFFSSLFTNTGIIADGNIIVFEDGLANEINKHDAIKMVNGGENFGIMRYDSLLAVEARNKIIEKDTIFYYIKNLRQQPYQFRFAPKNMPLNLTAFLVDRFNNTTIPVSLTDSSFVDFIVTGETGSNAVDRFILIFKPLTVVPVKIVHISAMRNSNQLISVKWEVENEFNVLQYKIERSDDGMNFRVIGESTPLMNNGGNTSYIYSDVCPLSKDNFYRVQAISQSGQVQYSDILKIALQKQASSITVYPNPTVDKTIIIKFANHPFGNCYVYLTNKLGQVIHQNTFYIGQSNIIKTILLNNIFVSGSYQLSIITSDETKWSEEIVVQ